MENGAQSLLFTEHLTEKVSFKIQYKSCNMTSKISQNLVDMT